MIVRNYFLLNKYSTCILYALYVQKHKRENITFINLFSTPEAYSVLCLGTSIMKTVFIGDIHN